MDTDDIKLDIPHISTGPDGGKAKKKREKDGKFKSAGGGSSRKKKPPPPPNNTKKLILGAGVLLCIVSLVAIILVVSGNFGSRYDTSMTQFTGDIQLEELDNDFVTWDEEYSDIKSPKSQALADKISSKLSKALQAEGIVVEGVEITKLEPLPPKTFEKNILQATSGRSAGTGRLRNSGSVTPEELAAMPYDTVEYKDMEFINMEYETKGKPGKNSGLFASAHGQWGNVADMVKSRMISAGAKVEVKQLKPAKEFVDTVFDMIENAPEKVEAPPAVPEPTAEKCDCEMTGGNIETSIICECEGSCKANNWIYGGENNEFSHHTKLCYAAYYAELIPEEGGKFEAIKLDVREIMNGPTKLGIETYRMGFASTIYKVKELGRVVKVSKNLLVKSDFEISDDDASIVFYLHYPKLDGNPVTYSDALKNLQSPEATDLATKIQTGVTKILKKIEYNPEKVKVTQFIMPPFEKGLIVRVDVTVESEENIKNTAKLESDEPGSLMGHIMITSMEHHEPYMSVISFRYGANYLNNFLDKM